MRLESTRDGPGETIECTMFTPCTGDPVLGAIARNARAAVSKVPVSVSRRRKYLTSWEKPGIFLTTLSRICSSRGR